jgi:TonB family protein
LLDLRVASLAFVLIAFGSPLLGHAQPATEPVTSPRPAQPTQVEYPALAHGDAEVVLELTVTKNGAVRELSVVSGLEPFASASLGAAAGWRFEPATRDGRPVAARVRMAIRFHQPEPAQSVAQAAPVAPPAEAPSSPTPPVEVLVFGERPDRAPTSLSQAEIRELPGAFGDPFRAVEALPGVTPLVSGAPYYYVRGAPPGNVGYFFDDVRVPLLYHIGLGPGVIHPALVNRVDFYPGGYPARYGRFAGGIVAGESTAPPPEWHGQALGRLGRDAHGSLRR